MALIDKMGLTWSDPDMAKSINQTLDEVISYFFTKNLGVRLDSDVTELVASLYDEWIDYSRDQVAIWYVSLRPITIKLKEIETGKVPQTDIVRWVSFSAHIFEIITNKISNREFVGREPLWRKEENESWRKPARSPLMESRPKTLPPAYYRNIQTQARKLEQALRNSGIRARVMQIHAGTTVCRYEFQVESNADVDLTLQIESDFSSVLDMEHIRIVPFPSPNKMGVEIPNEQRFKVTLKELMDGPSDRDADLLDIPLGREAASDTIIWGNLKTMSHLLICGAPDSGKTTFIRSMMGHLLLGCAPNRVQFSLIQGARDELNILNQAPHVISSIQNDPVQAMKTLHELVKEMEARFALLKEHEYEILAQYNTSNPEAYVPYLIVVIDEFAHLLTFDQQVEESIHQLTERGHLAGIHMVMSTGDTTSEVLADHIMKNVPSRLVFAVPSLETSMMLLDQGDAEKLLGDGDALFRSDDCSQPVRVQTPFTSPLDAEKWVNNFTPHEHDQKPSKVPHPLDEIYEQAVEFVVESQTASASRLQRKFRIGYTRAARLIDHMEKNHIIGPFEGSKPRQVLIKSREKREVNV